MRLTQTISQGEKQWARLHTQQPEGLKAPAQVDEKQNEICKSGIGARSELRQEKAGALARDRMAILCQLPRSSGRPGR